MKKIYLNKYYFSTEVMQLAIELAKSTVRLAGSPDSVAACYAGDAESYRYKRVLCEAVRNAELSIDELREKLTTS